MKSSHPSVMMIELVAKALGDMKDDVIFVGGSTIPLYSEDEASQEARPTEDVDCVVELMSYADFAKMEAKLRKKASHMQQKLEIQSVAGG